MKINLKDFRVREGDEVNLRKWPTNVEPVYKSKQHYQKLLGEHITQLSALQELLYASNRYAVLLIFQAVLGFAGHPVVGNKPAFSHLTNVKAKGKGFTVWQRLTQVARSVPRLATIVWADSNRLAPHSR